MESSRVLNDVLAERKRQDNKWGEQNHTLETWLMILGEEVGEVNRAALKYYYRNKDPYDYRTEMVQVAAVALAAIEAFDRFMALKDKL